MRRAREIAEARRSGSAEPGRSTARVGLNLIWQAAASGPRVRAGAGEPLDVLVALAALVGDALAAEEGGVALDAGADRAEAEVGEFLYSSRGSGMVAYPSGD